MSQLFKRCATAVWLLKGKHLIHFLESTVCEITGPVGVLESSKLSVSEAYAQHSSGVDWWVTGCVCEVRTRRTPPQPPTFSESLSSSVYPSLSPLTLTMALGCGEWTTEVNAPRRRGVIVNETEVKMSGWNRQIKEMGEEVDVWRERLKRDWHMSEKEKEGTWELQFESAMIFFFFFVTSLFFLLRHFTPDHSLFWPLLTLAAQAKLLIAPTFKCTDTKKWQILVPLNAWWNYLSVHAYSKCISLYDCVCYTHVHVGIYLCLFTKIWWFAFQKMSCCLG